jgi:transcriptional regulator with XRE-family HTH domain
MATTLAPQVRSQFAKRLKIIRTQKGFHRARYFASRLGIEENRYTRYERAEVEPSLTLIHKMCETLDVTPNELLGFDSLGQQAVGAHAGFADPSGEEVKAASEGPDAVSMRAWALASEAAALRHEQKAGKSGDDPLGTVRETGLLYRNLQSEPFETVARLADDPVFKAVDAGRKARLAELIRAFTHSIHEATPRRVRR